MANDFKMFPLFGRLWSRLGIQDLFVVLGALSLLVQQLSGLAEDPGTGWHLANGKWIAAERAVPVLDPFLSVTHPWVSDQWLSDLVLYGVFSCGSWTLLYAALTVIYLLSYFGVVYFGVAAITGSSIGAGLATFSAFKMGQMHFLARPAMFGFLFFAVVCLCVFGPMRRAVREGAPFPRALWFGMPLLFLVWAQAHPSFVLGIVLLGVTALGILLDRTILGRSIPFASMYRVLAMLAVCLVVTALNPYGIALHESILTLGRSEYFMNLHQEWLPLNPRETEGSLFKLIFTSVLASAVFGGLQRRWGSFELLALLGFAHLGMDSVRMLPYFAIVATVPLVEAWCSIGASPVILESGVLRRICQAFSNLEAREWRSSRGGVALAVCAVLILGHTVLFRNLPLYNGAFGPPAERYPYGAVANLLQRGAADTKVVVLAPPGWGGFIVWQGAGRLKPVLDDRNALLGEEPYRRFYRVESDPDGLAAYAADSSAGFLLLPAKALVTPQLRADPRFVVLFEDGVSSLFQVQ